MQANKDIGNALKENLQEFSKSPDTIVWDRIEGDLKKKKKRRFLFLLFLSSGLSLIAIFFLFNSNQFKNSNHPITNFQIDTTSVKESINKDKSIKNNAINSVSFNKKEKNKIHDSVQSSKKYNSSIIKTNDKKKKKLTQLNSNKKNILDTQKNNFNTVIKNSKRDNIKDENLNTKKIVSKRNSITDSKNIPKEKIKDSLANEKGNKIKEESKLDSINPIKFKRWSIMPYTSFDYFGSFNHNTNDNTTLNYGFKLSYWATEDITIRLGFSKLNLGFSTNNSSNNLTQKISYLEFPIEYKQNLKKGKINTSVIGGVSFLSIDERVNQNNNMSINLGLGFDTKIFKHLNFNIEPMFKYHFKPLENSLKSQTFTLSVIGGIEYKF